MACSTGSVLGTPGGKSLACEDILSDVGARGGALRHSMCYPKLIATYAILSWFQAKSAAAICKVTEEI
jgi:hypothetical protein